MALIKPKQFDNGVTGEYWNTKRRSGQRRVIYSTFKHPKTGVICKAVNIIMSCWKDKQAYESDMVTEPLFAEHKSKQLDIPDNMNFRDSLIYGFIQVTDPDFFGAVSDDTPDYTRDELDYLKTVKLKTVENLYNRSLLNIKSEYDMRYDKMSDEDINNLTGEAKTTYDEYKSRVDDTEAHYNSVINSINTVSDFFTVIY